MTETAEPAAGRRLLAAGPGTAWTSDALTVIAREIDAVLNGPGEPGRTVPFGRNAPWRRLGIFHVRAERLRENLALTFGVTLPATVFFDHPTPEALAEYLRGEVAGSPAAALPLEPRGADLDRDPIAIIGMGCRFPGGVRTPDELWELVLRGDDVTSELPSGRGWDFDAVYDPDPAHPGTTYCRRGGFLADADRFDAGFFNIGPREAAALDPQQRLLLETAWEAVERAGLDPLSLRGRAVGVYTGIAYSDYGPDWCEAPEGFAGHLLMGSLTSAASGRIAYTLGVEGPALTVDTACSSSLVTLHLAAQALALGECELALAGGATVMATPGVFLEFSRKRGLAADGRCRSFSADAAGTGWAEGAGMLVLERLSAARRHGHPVLAVVRGVAVNQDGASNGLTAPCGHAQQKVIRQALANARLTGGDVDAVEAHGTGTRLGDPIEAQAILATYGRDRPAGRPVWLGSLKSNIGHAQAAAGVGGVIKMVHALRAGILPPTLHVREPTPLVDWSAGAVRLLTGTTQWPETGRPRRCAVSAFGVSGTNAHVILEQAPPVSLPDRPEGPQPGTGREPAPWVVSAPTVAGLRAQAAALAEHVETRSGPSLADVGLSLARRGRFERRAVLLEGDRGRRAARLRTFAEEGRAPGMITGEAVAPGRLALLFTGQGSQRAGMGRELYPAFPAFAAALDEVCAHLDPWLDRPLREVMFAGESTPEHSLLQQTRYTQPALFALEVALHRLVESWGVRPDAVVGHSIGELSAAYVAGVWSLPDACTLVAARGRLMQRCRADGAMLTVWAGEERVRELLGDDPRPVDIAAANGPSNTVIAGDTEVLGELARRWRERGVRTQRLRVSHAFHSSHMDAMAREFRQIADTLTYRPPRLPVVSTVSGKVAPADQYCSPDYWVQQVRSTVRFFDGVRNLYDFGARTFVELGPGAGLTALAGSCLPEDTDLALLSLLRAGQPEDRAALTAAAQLHVRGVDVDFTGLFPGARQVDLPTYAFQRDRYWLASSRTGSDPAPLGSSARDAAAAADPGWFYRVEWRPVTIATSRLQGRWLLVAPADRASAGLVAAVTRSLRSRGAEVVPVTLGADETDRGSIRHALTEATEALPARGVLSLLALDEQPDTAEAVPTVGLHQTFSLAQALKEIDRSIPLWLVTRAAAVGARSGERINALQSMVWGLGQVAGLEHPGGWGGLVDLPADPGAISLERLCSVLAAGGPENQVALRGTDVLARRVRRGVRPAAAAGWVPRGTVLITGGTGALGVHVARWAARSGAGHLVLASRRGPAAAGARELARELAAAGVQVSVVSCDLADRAAVAALIESIDGLTAVVHAAGVAGGVVPLSDTGWAECAEVLRGKAAGAAHLHELLAHRHLDAFVLFSSIAGIWGSGGQAGYSAANAYLDGLAELRRAQGRPALSLAWGPWAEGGMAADAAVRDRLARRGLNALPPAKAIDAMERVLGSGQAGAIVTDVDWTGFLPAFTAGGPTRLFAELSESATDSRPASSPAEPTLPDRLSGLSGADREAELLRFVRVETADILGHSGEQDIDVHRPFLDLGFDSLASAELRRRLSASIGRELPAPVVFDHPTATELAAFLHTMLGEVTAGGDGTACPSGHEPQSRSGIKALFRRACEGKNLADGLTFLQAAARLRPVTHEVEQLVSGIELLQQSTGPQPAAIVCLPPFVAPSGPHNYARFAHHLAGRRDTFALGHPGFRGDVLPADAALLIRAQADVLCRRFADRRIVLTGYSSGGWCAHAVAQRLEELGRPADLVLLLDSLAVTGEAWQRIEAPLRTIAVSDQAQALTTDDQLTAMAHYFQLFHGWTPGAIDTPVLLVRAERPMPEWEGDAVSEQYWRAAWDYPHETLYVPGDHWTILNENAASTARVVHDWLSAHLGERPDAATPTGGPGPGWAPSRGARGQR
ncbi:type I polyketide synthase [Amycolatopsis sp. PS_44_ISF1]|uniref:type I polyketide synthase n=1 Tax=Amycolatopsis sp. PS_44_ISF1 TaxID=2974917 RepID=UPI0028E02F78|nr:type I polyketide synthase [Amycolatopsis sp. PS_44_ISF1]MDT8914663.1 type I polyketide synthase [Amycolatopsis sp. PS_44_ISF1]